MQLQTAVFISAASIRPVSSAHSGRIGRGLSLWPRVNNCSTQQGIVLSQASASLEFLDTEPGRSGPSGLASACGQTAAMMAKRYGRNGEGRYGPFDPHARPGDAAIYRDRRAGEEWAMMASRSNRTRRADTANHARRRDPGVEGEACPDAGGHHPQTAVSMKIIERRL